MPPESQLTPGAARVVDPVLSNVARGYENAGMAWPSIFPVVTVMQRGGKVIEFGAEHFAEFDIERAPGARIPEINVGFSSRDYALVQRALAGKVPVELQEEAGAVPGIDLGSVAVQRVMAINSLQIEIKAASLIVADNFTDRTKALAAGAQWSHADSAPAKEVRSVYSTIRQGIGMDPNTLFVGKPVHDALINNPDVIDRIKHTQPAIGDAIDEAALARYFRVAHYVVGSAMKGEPGAFEEVWGKIALLCYSNVSPLAGQGAPSFGYTYRLSGYPMVEPPWYNRANKSWMYPVTNEDTPEIVGKAAGYLWTAAVE